jgi:hypothetical protein
MLLFHNKYSNNKKFYLTTIKRDVKCLALFFQHYRCHVLLWAFPFHSAFILLLFYFQAKICHSSSSSFSHLPFQCSRTYASHSHSKNKKRIKRKKYLKMYLTDFHIFIFFSFSFFGKFI